MSENSDVRVRRAGTVAIAGRSNVGKSTLLNAALQQPLAAVSRKPQTTRTPLLGIVRHPTRGHPAPRGMRGHPAPRGGGEAEIAFLDTPGLHKARSQLGREMNRAAHDALRDADVIVYVVAAPLAPKGELVPHARDVALIARLAEGKRVVLVINKVDRIRDKGALLPLIAAFSAVRPFAAIVPISALAEDGIGRVLDEVARLLPASGPRYQQDALTDRPARHFAAEYVREAILRATAEEVPHAVAVTIDDYLEPAGAGNLTRIAATIVVERDGQKRIVIGNKGGLLKRIGSEARQRIAALIGGRVHLELWVRVSKDWRERAELLAEFGLCARARRASR